MYLVIHARARVCACVAPLPAVNTQVTRFRLLLAHVDEAAGRARLLRPDEAAGLTLEQPRRQQEA